MERYFISGVSGRAEPCVGGPWVLYRDAQAAVKEATKRAEDAERERDEWKRDAENAGKERWAETQRAERAEGYVAGEDLRSDFRTAAEMRAALDSTIQSIVTACKGSGCLNAHELRAALDRTHKRATNAEKERADAERRLALAVAEVKAWRLNNKLTAEEDETGEEVVGMSEAKYNLHHCIDACNHDPVLAKMIGGGE